MSIQRYLAVTAGVFLLCACATTNNEVVSNNEVDVDEQDSAQSVERRASINFKDAAKDEDRIICKRTVPTGTRFARRECRSWREWREMMEATQSVLDEGQRRNLQTDVSRGN